MPLKVSSAYRRLARWEWPSSFPLLQFPNPPLVIALLASLAATLTESTAHEVARALFYMALTAWAYEELRDGDNWFRRLLGLGFAIYILATLAHALDS
jgi:hypothetical protein